MLAAAAAALCLMGAGRGGDPGGVHRGGDSRGGAFRGGGMRSYAPSAGRAPSTIYRRQHIAMPRAPMPSHAFRDQGRAVVPQRNEFGERITKPRATVPPANHLQITRNPALVRGIQRQQRAEVAPHHYYWHNVGGIRYAHYYDGRYHWYGFYHGPRFYWTRYYDDRWWWYDALSARWDFWWDGYWWWPGPGGLPYVYIDDDYYPYEGSGVTVEQAEEQPAPAKIPAPGAGAVTESPDGRRMVQIGSDGEAFLFDKTKTPPSFLKYLGAGVSRVRFSGGSKGTPPQMLVEYDDDTFALFDADGNSLSSAVKKEDAAPPAAPQSIPPPPTSAPGQ
jgi:hypothetical protein